jgi:hypothetical protein
MLSSDVRVTVYRQRVSRCRFPVVVFAVTLAAVAGCTDEAPARPGPSQTTRPPAVRAVASPSPSTAVASTSASMSPLVSPAAKPAANEPPEIRSVRSVPEILGEMKCRPPDPPERPEVIAEVVDADDRPDKVIVRLQYQAVQRYTGSPGYSGDVTMRFDPARKRFVYRLPPVTIDEVGPDPASIGLMLVARNAPSMSDPRPLPTSSWIFFAGPCLAPSIKNG